MKPSSNVRTGIKGLDHVLSGGVPSGGLYLVSGGTGAGKTIFSLQFCAQGADEGENCLFLTLEESRDWISSNMPPELAKRLSSNDKRVFFLDLASLRALSIKKEDEERRKGLDMLMLAELLERWHSERKLGRCVIDGISSLAAGYNNEQDIREDLFYLSNVLKRLGLTTLLTMEASGENSISRYGVEEFVSDGAFMLRREGARRTLEIIKVRGRDFHPGPHELDILSDGVHLYPRVIFQRPKKCSNKTCSFGIPGVDTLLGGGIIEGDATILNGSPGSGKNLFAFCFLEQALKNGEKTLYVTFKQSKASLFRDAHIWGFDLASMEKKGLLRVLDTPAIDVLPHRHLYQLKTILPGVSRVVIDSLEDYSKTLSHSKDTNIVYYQECLLGIIKETGSNALIISDSPEIMGASFAEENQMLSLVDNIILLRYVEDNSKLKGAINVLKKRSGTFSREIREFTLQKNTVTIGKPFEGMSGLMSPKATRTDKAEKFFS